jgi:transcriptional regulator
MYVPHHFQVSDLEELHAFIVAHGFATLVSSSEAGPFATHLPLMLDTGSGDHGKLIGHMARANPHWRQFASGQSTLAIFHGPHAYISPAWYVSRPTLPTWNYAAVHAYGHPVLIEEPPRVRRLLDELVAASESRRAAPWANDLPEDFRSKMERAIVAFEIPINRIEGKFKLSQNRTADDQWSALESLELEGGSPELVELWRRLLPARDGDS